MSINLENLLDNVEIPNANSKIYKEECTYSFSTALENEGLFVDLKSFLAFNKKYAMMNYEKTKHRVYLHIKQVQTKIEKNPEETKPTQTIHGIAIEDEVQYKIDQTNSLVILPEFKEYTDLESKEIPDKIKKSIDKVLTTDAETRKQAVVSLTDERMQSAFALSLVQINNGVKIPPSGWKCAKCDLTQNLWLNLTDGTILCGRKNYDGSGGNGHAKDYFQQTGFPVCVKLGTITANGQADVFSYPEDDMVEDPLLAQHLLHFGINIEQMQKTEKTMDELNYDLNLNFDWGRIQENNKKLTPLYGSGFTGIKNLGNSCYMASVMQAVFSIPEFVQRYVNPAEEIFRNSNSYPADDLETQLAKFGVGLTSGEHSQEPTTSEEKENEKNEVGVNGINPRMLKTLVGKGHPEFATSRQQDALEYFQYLMNLIERDEHKRQGGKNDPSKTFKFTIEERIQCSTSNKVKYTHRTDNILSVPIPIDQSVIDEQERFENETKKRRLEQDKLQKEAKEKGIDLTADQVKDDVQKYNRPTVTLVDCLKAFSATETVNDFYSTAINAKTTAYKQTKLSTFPDYLVIHMRKFYVGKDWTPKKLDVFLDVPDKINLDFLRSTGLKPTEETLPEDSSKSSSAPKEITADSSIVDQLVQMGFTQVRCQKAAIATKNAGVDEAMNWVLEHMDDPDIDEPIKSTSSSKVESASIPISEEGIAMLNSMGFTVEQAKKALKATNNDIERATEWIFSHADDMDQSEPVEETKNEVESKQTVETGVKDGNTEYSLFGFVSHLGTSAQSGHYVCHLLKNGKWAQFNDTKVAQSEEPPKDMGYLYIYKRN